MIDSSNYDLKYDRNRIRYGVQQLKERGLLQGPAILEAISYFQQVRAIDLLSVDTWWNGERNESSLGGVLPVQ